MTDEQFLQLLAGQEYEGLSALEMAARREAVKYPTEFPPFFRMRPFLIDAIHKGWVVQEADYRLRIAITQELSAD